MIHYHLTVKRTNSLMGTSQEHLFKIDLCKKMSVTAFPVPDWFVNLATVTSFYVLCKVFLVRVWGNVGMAISYNISKAFQITRDIRSRMCAFWTAAAEGHNSGGSGFQAFKPPTCVSDCGLTGWWPSWLWTNTQQRCWAEASYLTRHWG